MPHVLLVDIDEETLAAIDTLVNRKANIAPSIRLGSDTAAHLINDSAGASRRCATPARNGDFSGRSSSGSALGAPCGESRTVLMFASWNLNLSTHELTGKDDAQIALS